MALVRDTLKEYLNEIGHKTAREDRILKELKDNLSDKKQPIPQLLEDQILNLEKEFENVQADWDLLLKNKAYQPEPTDAKNCKDCLDAINKILPDLEQDKHSVATKIYTVQVSGVIPAK